MESKQRYVTGLEKLAFAASAVCTVSRSHVFTVLSCVYVTVTFICTKRNYALIYAVLLSRPNLSRPRPANLASRPRPWSRGLQHWL